MPAIPGQLERGLRIRSDLDYARFGVATWKWWCVQHGFTFVLLDSPIGGERYSMLPPTVQRWLAPELLSREYGSDASFAIVDADTMIRWDTPDLFELAIQQFAVVRTGQPAWIWRSINAYQHLFPEVNLPWWEYFNAGIVVVGGKHAELLREFAVYFADRWPEMHAIQLSGDVGSDQTPLNFFLRGRGTDVHFMPATFNYVHCFRLPPPFYAFETGASKTSDLSALFRGLPSAAFDFTEFAHVWHFSNVVRLRHAAMEVTWQHVAENYPGAVP
jgi:hypothetical protein